MEWSELLDGLTAALGSADTWLQTQVFTWPSFVQLILLTFALLAAFLAQRIIAAPMDAMAARAKQVRLLAKPAERLRPLILPLTAMALVWGLFAILVQLDHPSGLLRIVGNLFTAWVIIRLFSSFLNQSPWSPVIATIVWMVAALAILGWLDPLRAFLDSAAFQAGEMRVSALGVINSLLILVAFLIISSVLLRLVDDRMRSMSAVTPCALGEIAAHCFHSARNRHSHDKRRARPFCGCHILWRSRYWCGFWPPKSDLQPVQRDPFAA